jgi:hypothetical protein
MIWANAADHLRGLMGVEMADAEGWSPASNWEQGDVDIRHLIQRKVWTCVPRVPAPAGARYEIAQRGSTMRAPRESTAVMVGGQHMYLQAAKLQEVTRLDLTELRATSGDRLDQAA